MNSLIRIKRSGVKEGGQPDRNRDPLSASETRNQRNISKKNCKLYLDFIFYFLSNDFFPFNE